MEILASLGLMWILKHGSILSLPREYIKSISNTMKNLLECSMCLGFWCGVVFLLINFKVSGFNIELIYLPFASSAVCWFFDSLLDLIQESSVSISSK
tara:strand:- start:9863 stop:10153 length:291 start_codon:yes stop_codon:yes gene_type:complete